MRASTATALNVMGCPVAVSSAQAASARGRWPSSAGIGLAEQQVEPFGEAAVAGGLGAPAAGGGVGGEGFGSGSLRWQDGREAGGGAGVRAVLAGARGGARSLGGGAAAV